MIHQRYRTTLITGAVIVSLATGLALGYFTAHQMMDDRDDMRNQESTTTATKMDGMKTAKDGRDMEVMPGMVSPPSGGVAIPAVARQLIGVRSTPVVRGTLNQEIRAVGSVGVDERGLTQVTVKTPGWVRDVFLNTIGQPVHKGERLLTLYSPDLLATQDEYLLAAKMRAQLADSPLEEAKTNAASLADSARERLRLWDMTDAQIAALSRRGRAEPIVTMYAPSSGTVLTRTAVPGKYVEPGMILYEMADLSMVWILADIYESEVAAVKLNQPATVTIAAYQGQSFSGTVAYIYPSLNTDTRTVRVRVELPNPDLKLKPGMYGTVILNTDAVTTLVVPKEAVLETGLRQLVFRDRGEGRYEPASIKLGRRSQDAVEVLEGLHEGDQVVTSANFLLDAEAKLTSATSMQAMMGQIGMADWQMRGAHEGTMGGMDMGNTAGKIMAETRQTNGISFSVSTVPEKPKAGDVLIKLAVTDQAGKPVTDAQVVFVYTMPMPGMTDSKAAARHIKDGLYEGTVMFGMGGTWVVTVHVARPGRPPIAERFQFSVAGGGMSS